VRYVHHDRHEVRLVDVPLRQIRRGQEYEILVKLVDQRQAADEFTAVTADSASLGTVEAGIDANSVGNGLSHEIMVPLIDRLANLCYYNPIMYAAYPIYTLSEAELRSFLRQPKDRTRSLGSLLGALCLVTCLGLGGFYLLNFDAFQRISQSQAAVVVPSASPVPSAVPQPSATPAPVVVIPDIPNNTVSYANLNIAAPITWDVPIINDSQVIKLLPDGVIQAAGTAHPGQHGITVITGHSSNYFWIKGSYNSIFAPLQNAKVGDTIKINYNNKMYVYSVTKQYVVKPEQLNVLNAADFDGLRLITCTPVGTSTNRLVVEAKQVTPDPSTNSAFNQTVFKDGSIPSGQ